MSDGWNFSLSASVCARAHQLNLRTCEVRTCGWWVVVEAKEMGVGKM